MRPHDVRCDASGGSDDSRRRGAGDLRPDPRTARAAARPATGPADRADRVVGRRDLALRGCRPRRRLRGVGGLLGRRRHGAAALAPDGRALREAASARAATPAGARRLRTGVLHDRGARHQSAAPPLLPLIRSTQPSALRPVLLRLRRVRLPDGADRDRTVPGRGAAHVGYDGLARRRAPHHRRAVADRGERARHPRRAPDLLRPDARDARLSRW